MSRWNISSRTIVSAVVTGTLLGGALTGCTPVSTPDTEKTEESTVEFGDVSGAVTAATPRVTEVSELRRSRNGFAFQITVGLESNSNEPFTADELDAVVKAIWSTAPWEINTITLAAGAETPSGYAGVDLRTAASELTSLRFQPAGAGGVSLTGMEGRYGAWTAPE